MESHLRRARPALIAGILLAAAGVARGDAADVFNATIGYGVNHDSNVFKLAPEADAEAVIGTSDRSDAYARSTLRLTADKVLGRQTLHAAAGLTRLRYDRFRQLDDDLSDISGSLDWVLGRLWSGLLKVGRSETAPGFSEYSTLVADRVTTDTAEARAILRFHPDWRLTLGASSVDQTHSAEVNSVGDSSVRGLEAGMRYVPGTGKDLGISWRRSEGSYPNPQMYGPFAVDNSYVQESLDINGAWQPSGASSFTGSLGRARRRHAEVPGRDFYGRIGSLAWDWKVSGKTSLNTAVRRNIDTEGDLNASYAVTDLVSVRAAWAPTAKLSLQASLEERWRDYQGDPTTVIGLPARRDEYQTASVSASYAPLRDLRISVSLLAERRDSNFPGNDYRTRQGNATVQFTF